MNFSSKAFLSRKYVYLGKLMIFFFLQTIAFRRQSRTTKRWRISDSQLYSHWSQQSLTEKSLQWSKEFYILLKYIVRKIFSRLTYVPNNLNMSNGICRSFCKFDSLYAKQWYINFLTEISSFVLCCQIFY